jgi:hypothetical protein
LILKLRQQNKSKKRESLDLIVSVTGKGNMKLFNLPKPVVPNALKMYDPVRNERVNTSLGMSERYRKTIQSYHSIKEIIQ